MDLFGRKNIGRTSSYRGSLNAAEGSKRTKSARTSFIESPREKEAIIMIQRYSSNIKIEKNCMKAKKIQEKAEIIQWNLTLNKFQSLTVYANYYDVTIVERGTTGSISIGLATSDCDLHAHIGWSQNSYGYFGEDGTKWSNGKSTVFGTTFRKGDVIGCGYIKQANQVFFTKNKEFIGIAFQEILVKEHKDGTEKAILLYPTVSLGDSNVKVNFNFGPEFLFDLKVLEERERLRLMQVQAELAEEELLHQNKDNNNIKTEEADQKAKKDKGKEKIKKESNENHTQSKNTEGELDQAVQINQETVLPSTETQQQPEEQTKEKKEKKKKKEKK